MKNTSPDNVVLSHGSCSNIESEYYPPHHPQHWMRGWAGKYCLHWHRHGIMGRRFPDVGLLRYRKWVPQQLWDVNKQGSGESRPMGARHGDTAANHMDLQSWCGQTCVFAVRVWLNLWDLIWLRTSHYSMGQQQTPADKLDKDSRASAASSRRGSSSKQQRIFGPSGRLGKYFVWR